MTEFCRTVMVGAWIWNLLFSFDSLIWNSLRRSWCLRKSVVLNCFIKNNFWRWIKFGDGLSRLNWTILNRRRSFDNWRWYMWAIMHLKMVQLSTSGTFKHNIGSIVVLLWRDKLMRGSISEIHWRLIILVKMILLERLGVKVNLLVSDIDSRALANWIYTVVIISFNKAPRWGLALIRRNILIEIQRSIGSMASIKTRLLHISTESKRLGCVELSNIHITLVWIHPTAFHRPPWRHINCFRDLHPHFCCILLEDVDGLEIVLGANVPELINNGLRLSKTCSLILHHI